MVQQKCAKLTKVVSSSPALPKSQTAGQNFVEVATIVQEARHTDAENKSINSSPTRHKRCRCSKVKIGVDIFLGFSTLALTYVIARANYISSEQTKRANDIQEQFIRLTNFPHFILDAEGNDLSVTNASPHIVRITNEGSLADQIQVNDFRTVLEINFETDPVAPGNVMPLYVDLTKYIYRTPTITKNKTGIVYQTEPAAAQSKILHEVFASLRCMPIFCNYKLCDYASISYYNPNNGEYKQLVLGNIGETDSIKYQAIVSDSDKYERFRNRRDNAEPLAKSIAFYCTRSISNKTGLLHHRRSTLNDNYNHHLPDLPVPMEIEKLNLTSNDYLQDVFYLLGCHYRLAAINIGESNPKNSVRKLIYLFYAANCFNQSASEESQWGLDATFCQITYEDDEGFLEDYFTHSIHPFTEDAIRILEEISNNPRNREILRTAAKEFLEVAKRAKAKPPKSITWPIKKEAKEETPVQQNGNPAKDSDGNHKS